MKNKLFLSLSIMMLIAIPARASLQELPGGSIGQGSAVHSGGSDNLFVKIDYAVYDRDSGGLAGYDAPGDGQYIYAYQIFTNNDTAAGYSAVASLSIPGVSTASITGIGTVDDQSGDALDAENDGSSLAWEFMEVNLVDGAHSFFLVFSSDSAPVYGEYKLTAKNDDILIPEFIPEPTTIALLGLGMFPALLKRKKSNK